MIGGVLTASLEAEERFFNINVQQVVGSVLFQCLPLLAVLLMGPSLEAAAIGAAAARLFSLAWNAWVSFAIVHHGARPRVSLHHAPSLLKYGGWVTVTNLISPLLASADQFLIARMLGPVAVAHYSVPFSFAMKAQLLPGSLTRALFPRFSNLDREAAFHLADRSISTLAWVMALACAPATFVVGFCLTLWVGHDFAAAATPVAQVLLVGTWINGIASVPFALLQAQGRPDIVARFHAFEIIPFLLVLWALMSVCGLTGAAYAWVLRVGVDTALLLWAIGRLKECVRQLAFPGLVVIASWIWASAVPAAPAFAFAEAFLTASCIFAVMLFKNEQVCTLVEKRFDLYLGIR